jgi:hypothetical protein
MHRRGRGVIARSALQQYRSKRTETVRIVTWNCNLRLSKKLDRLLGIEPDFAIVQECERELSYPTSYFYKWCGNDLAKRLGVLSRGEPLALESTHREEWTYFLPLYLPKRIEAPCNLGLSPSSGALREAVHRHASGCAPRTRSMAITRA